ncbi:MAG TPA: four helix bundle protein [Candidatus Saccharibacteria bacterium]|nr:four helix bundle protein [Candidatus Saccharibacteria bacterium]
MALYKDLVVWQKAIDLVVDVYGVIDKLPSHEKFALADQMRRSAVSVPSNIAEGQRRASVKEVIQFTAIASGSLAELETQLVLVEKLYNIDTSSNIKKTTEISKMLAGLIRSLRQ